MYNYGDLVTIDFCECKDYQHDSTVNKFLNEHPKLHCILKYEKQITDEGSEFYIYVTGLSEKINLYEYNISLIGRSFLYPNITCLAKEAMDLNAKIDQVVDTFSVLKETVRGVLSEDNISALEKVMAKQVDELKALVLIKEESILFELLQLTPGDVLYKNYEVWKANYDKKKSLKDVPVCLTV